VTANEPICSGDLTAMIATDTQTTTIATGPPRLRLVTKAHICDAYVISLATLDRLIRHQGFPHLKVGARVLFRIEDVESFFAQRVHPKH